MQWAYGNSGLPAEQKVTKAATLHRHKKLEWSGGGLLMSIQNMLTGSLITFEYSEGFLTKALHQKGWDARAELYSRDAEGNIYNDAEHTDRQYSPGGRLQRMGGTYYRYDPEGNLLAANNTSGETLYYWNHNGSLHKVLMPDRTAVSFEYDALGRRTAKIAGNKIFRYLWDGNVLLHEWSYDTAERPQLVVDEIGYVVKDKAEPITNLITWVFKDGGFEPMARLDNTGEYSIICDHIGTPVEAYNSIGKKVWERELEAYGKIKREIGEINLIPFQLSGQYFDIETGLCNQRYRYFSPDIGAFISKDPIGLAGGNPTMYGFVFDSNTQIDPFGLLTADELARVQKMGANAEIIAQNQYGFTKNTEQIRSLKQGRYHIPDGMTNTTIYEVKCVGKQGYTRQIKSYVATGKNVVVIVDTDTTLSKHLQQAWDDGKLKVERTDLKNRPKVGCN